MSGLRRFEIEVRAVGPLLVGGHSAPEHGGDKASARDLRGRPMIPASALRGALRIELERLLRGRDGDDAVCGANLEAGEARGEPCTCPVCRLFGQEGHGLGSLRLEDAVLAEGSRAVPVLRPQVAVGRRSGSAVSGHLAFMEAMAAAEAEPPVYCARGHLAPRSVDETPEALAEDLRNLRAAAAALFALGGGKARGFGWVECDVREAADEKEAEKPPSVAPASAGGTVSLRLRLEARAPLHFGDGRPLGGFLPTRASAPGSTVRGAVAFALLEQGLCGPDDGRFQSLVVGGDGAASFGTARGAGDRPSATRRRCRPNDHVFDDLVGEILRRQSAEVGVALAIRAGGACTKDGCTATKAQPWPWRERHPEPWRRVRTRTAINRRTGTAMDQKLYSVEVLEPEYARGAGKERVPLELVAEVRGLSGEAAELLATLHGREVWLGGRRSRGMGRCLVRVEEAVEPEVELARQAADSLTREVARAWAAVRAAVGEAVDDFPGKDQALVAIVLEEPWAPEDGSRDLENGPLGAEAKPIHRFLHVVEEGRFGAVEASRFGAPQAVTRGEIEPVLAAAPGSIFVARIARSALDAHLARWLTLGRRGSGRNREIGWGRFSIRGPALDD